MYTTYKENAGLFKRTWPTALPMNSPCVNCRASDLFVIFRSRPTYRNIRPKRACNVYMAPINTGRTSSSLYFPASNFIIGQTEKRKKMTMYSFICWSPSDSHTSNTSAGEREAASLSNSVIDAWRRKINKEISSVLFCHI